MKWGNLFMLAYRALGKNKLRTFLTMLGIIIGVASVIAMLAIGEGSKQSIKTQISSLGTNILIIMPGSTTGPVRADAGSAQSLTLADADAIRNRCSYISAVSPMVQTRAQAVYASKNWRPTTFGVYPEYLYIRNLKVQDGTMFSMYEVKTAAKVCLVGKTVVTNLFGEDASPLGEIIRVKNIPMKIIGVLEPKGQNTFGQDQDDIIIAPFFTVQKRLLAVTFVNQILASAVSEEDITNATDEVTELLNERHRISVDKETDFTIRTQTEIAKIVGSTTAVLTVLLAIIASISLLVGGIGIMNIMYVSVTERTREIGLRLAIGARGMDVLLQFLIEAILISVLGGIIGILLGWG